MRAVKALIGIVLFVWAGSSIVRSGEATPSQSTDPVVNGEYRTLNNTQYALTSGNLDPGPDEIIDRLSLSIRGEDAKRIYQSMNVAEDHTYCDGSVVEGHTRKIAGEFECWKYKNDYDCFVSILFENGETRTGYICD